MDLAQLKFVVDTSELDTAAKKISTLADAVSKINKPVTDAALKSEKLAQAQAKTAEAAAKSEAAQLRLQQAQDRTNTTTKTSVSVLERQQMILEAMTQGFSKGQASTIAYAKAAGIASDELKLLESTLVSIKTLQGTDPFDKSIGVLQSWTNKANAATEAAKLYSQGLGLTFNQMEELGREKIRLIEKFKLEGKTVSDAEKEYEKLIHTAVQLNNTRQSIIAGIDKEEKLLKDTAKAQSYLAKEDERVNRLTQEQGNITSATNNALIRYETALKNSGLSAAEQAKKLDLYKKSLLDVQKAAGNRQVDYLSRALGPQITDIAVGLATGQSPMMVLLQQGGQLRDQFALAGVAGKEMGAMLTQAAASMVTSVKDVAMAVSGALVNAFIALGKTITTAALSPFKLFAAAISDMISGTNTTASALEGLRVSFIALGKIGVVALIAGIAGLAKGLYDVVQQEDALAKQLALTGGSLGLSQTAAILYAKSLNEVGVSTDKAISVITEMAKQGGFVSSEIAMVTKSAVDMQKYAGISIEDTVKSFAKMKEKPVDALFELAISTGKVSTEITTMVMKLVEQGKTAEATALAMKTLSDVNNKQVEQMKQDYSGFATFMKGLASEISDFFSSVFKDLWYKSSPEQQINSQIDSLKKRISEFNPLVVFGPSKKELEEQLNILERRRGAQARLRDETARFEATQSDLNKALDSFRKDSEQFATNAQKREKELAEATIRNDKLIAAGIITKSQAEEQYQNIRNKYKDTKTDEQKEVEKLQRAAEKTLSRIANLTNDATREQEQYTKAQKLALDIFADPNFAKYNETTRIAIAQAIERAHAEELLGVSIEKQRLQNAKATEEYLKNIAAQDNAWISAFDANVAANRAVMEESEALALQASLIGATDEQRRRSIKTRQIELELAKELREIEAKKLTPEDQANFELEARKRAMEKIKNLNTEIAIDSAKKLYDGVSDAIVTALFEGGQAGKKKLRDLIVAELKKPVTLVVNAVVNTILGNVLNSIGLGQAGSGAVGNMAGSAIGSAISNFAIAGSTLGQMGSYFATGFMNTVAGTGLQASTAAGSAIGGANGFAMQAGAYAAPVAGALGGMALNRGISGEYSTGSTMRTIQDIATIAATAVFGPLGGLAAGAISGVFNRAFGMGAKKVTAEDIVGTFSTSGANVQNRSTWKQKGGWFRSDKSGVNYSAISDEMQTYFDSTLIAISDTTKKYATILGFNANAIDGINQDITISLLGLTDEQKSAKIKEAFVSFGDRLAQDLLGSFETTTSSSGSFFRKVVTTTEKWIAGPYVRQGETASVALERLANSLASVNSFLKDLNFTLYDATLKSADFASTLIDAFGGLENLTSQITNFYQEFYTEQEKYTNLTVKLTEAFSSLGKSLPTTREDFKKMVEEAFSLKDAEALKILMSVQAGVVEYLTPMEEAQKAAIEAQKQYADSINQTTKTVVDEINRLRGVDTTAGSLQSQFAQLTMQARSGDLSALTKLPDITKSLEQFAVSNASSYAESVLARANLAQSLQDTLSYFGVSMNAGSLGSTSLSNVPSVTLSNTNNASSSSTNVSATDLLSSLIEEVQGLRVEVRADVSANSKTSRILERVNQDGESLTVTTLA